MTRPKLVLALAVLALSALAPASARAQTAAWRTDRACTAADGVRRHAVPRDAGEEPGCPGGACVRLPDGRRVCACHRDEGQVEVRVERPGSPARVVFVDPEGTGHPARLQVIDADLDGDGARELVAAYNQSVSNGMAVAAWRLVVVEGRRPEAEPAMLAVADFAFPGSLVRPARGGGCRVLATEWVEGSEAGRGAGLYLQATWMRYADGRFARDAARPVVRRRYTYALQRQRFAEDGGGGPWGWLRSPSTHVAPATP